MRDARLGTVREPPTEEASASRVGGFGAGARGSKGIDSGSAGVTAVRGACVRLVAIRRGRGGSHRNGAGCVL